MTHLDALDFLLLLGRKIERVAQKDIPVPVIAEVVGYNRLESLGESNFLHQQKTCVSNALLKIIGKTGRATAVELAGCVPSYAFGRCCHYCCQETAFSNFRTDPPTHPGKLRADRGAVELGLAIDLRL